MALYPDPALRTVAQPVTEYGAPAAALGDALVGAMDRLGAVGLAANQMHVDARVIALGGAATPTIFVNPRIVQRSDELRMVPWREVCLTLPEIDGVDLLRDEWVDVDFESTDGAPVSTRLTGERARAFQHELDHLDGVLIIDHTDEASLPPAMARREHALHDARQRRAFARRVEPAARRRARTVVALAADDDSGGALGPALAVGALAITAALALGIASLLGLDVSLLGDADNRGIGVPLSVNEQRDLMQAGARADPDAPPPSTAYTEDDRETQALLDIIQGTNARAK